MQKGKDIRTLCSKCYSDMWNAGMNLIEISKKTSRCDKCGRPGRDYEVKS